MRFETRRAYAIEKMGMTNGKMQEKSVTEGKTIRVSYDGFSLFFDNAKGKLTAAYSLNCCCADGVLQGGIGYEFYRDFNGNFVQTAPIEKLKAVYLLDSWASEDGMEIKTNYFALGNDGYIYQYSSEQGEYQKKARLGKSAGIAAAVAPNGETRFLVAGENGICCVDGEKWVLISGAGVENGTAAVCFSKNRVFVGEKPCKLLYSNPEAPWDFTSSYDEGGYVYLPLNKGNIVDITEYGDSVYIFFQRGIMRLKPDGLARNFQLSETEYFGGEIFGGSVGVCGNWIFFLTENGICRFDGKQAETVGRFLGVTPLKDGQTCAHATVGEYFVLQYEDESWGGKRTAALRSDGKDGYYLSDFKALNECNRMPICSVDNYFATLRMGGALPSGEECVFLSGRLDFGTAGRKYLKSITLYGEGCFSFEVIHDWKTTRFEVEDLPMKGSFKIGISAEEFSLRFLLDKGAKVRRVELEYERIN